MYKDPYSMTISYSQKKYIEDAKNEINEEKKKDNPNQHRIMKLRELQYLGNLFDGI